MKAADQLPLWTPVWGHLLDDGNLFGIQEVFHGNIENVLLADVIEESHHALLCPGCGSAFLLDEVLVLCIHVDDFGLQGE